MFVVLSSGVCPSWRWHAPCRFGWPISLLLLFACSQVFASGSSSSGGTLEYFALELFRVSLIGDLVHQDLDGDIFFIIFEVSFMCDAGMLGQPAYPCLVLIVWVLQSAVRLPHQS